jgi:hypothetical protein
MGQFKPMVKMTTTEPSVELKLKSGGAVKMQMGGALAATPAAGPAMRGAPARGGMMPAKSPGKPSLADRRRAMKAGPTGAAPAGPMGMAGRMMKKGGDTLAEHAAKPASKAHKGLKTGGVVDGQGGYKSGGIIKSTKGKTKMDTAKPDHSPAKTGDVKMGNAGGYATGGVAKANGGGYKKGGDVKMAMGGMSPSSAPTPRKFRSADALRYLRATGDKAGADQILKAAVGIKGANVPERFYELNKEPYAGQQSIATETTNTPGKMAISEPPVAPQVSSAPPPVPAPKPVPMGPGAMKKGGAAKKAYATGGLVDSGRPVAMPQGAKKPSKPVSINQLSGTFKRGGAVKMKEGGKAETPPKGVEDTIQTARNERAYKAWEKSQAEENKAMSQGIGSMFSTIPRKLKEIFSAEKPASSPGSVTKTEKSVTVTPKKRGGAVTC